MLDASRSQHLARQSLGERILEEDEPAPKTPPMPPADFLVRATVILAHVYRNPILCQSAIDRRRSSRRFTPVQLFTSTPPKIPTTIVEDEHDIEPLPMMVSRDACGDSRVAVACRK